MLTTSRRMPRMPDVRAIILARMQALDLSQYALVQKLKGKVSERPLYSFLAGDSNLNSKSLGHVLDAIGLELKPKRP